MVTLEASCHPEDPVAALTAQVFAIFDASLVDPDRLIEIIGHGFAFWRYSVTDGLVNLGLLHEGILTLEGLLELLMLLQRICIKNRLHFLNSLSSSLWYTASNYETTFRYLTG